MSQNLIFEIIDSKDPIQFLNENLKTNEKEIDYKKLLFSATYHNEPAIMKWCFKHKELIPNINLNELFKEINKHGSGSSIEQYQILIDNGYNNYEKILNKIYDKFPKFINSIITFIPPNKEFKQIENFPKNKKQMAKYINDLYYESNNILNCFPISTLQNIIFTGMDEENNESNEKEEYYDSKKEYLEAIKRIRDYHESKKEPRYMCRLYLELLISDIINSEMEVGNYKPTDYPIFHLAHGLIMENNWEYLDDEGKQIIANLYGVESIFEDVFAAQGKIIKQLSKDKKLSEDLNTRGVSMLDGLY